MKISTTEIQKVFDERLVFETDAYQYQKSNADAKQLILASQFLYRLWTVAVQQQARNKKLPASTIFGKYLRDPNFTRHKDAIQAIAGTPPKFIVQNGQQVQNPDYKNFAQNQNSPFYQSRSKIAVVQKNLLSAFNDFEKVVKDLAGLEQNPAHLQSYLTNYASQQTQFLKNVVDQASALFNTDPAPAQAAKVAHRQYPGKSHFLPEDHSESFRQLDEMFTDYAGLVESLFKEFYFIGNEQHGGESFLVTMFGNKPIANENEKAARLSALKRNYPELFDKRGNLRAAPQQKFDSGKFIQIVSGQFDPDSSYTGKKANFFIKVYQRAEQVDKSIGVLLKEIHKQLFNANNASYKYPEIKSMYANMTVVKKTFYQSFNEILQELDSLEYEEVDIGQSSEMRKHSNLSSFFTKIQSDLQRILKSIAQQKTAFKASLLEIMTGQRRASADTADQVREKDSARDAQMAQIYQRANFANIQPAEVPAPSKNRKGNP